MSRWKAAAIHLSISATIGVLTLILLFGVWYPPPYFHAGGADELVLLLVGVDLTLGPLLTLVVFRSGKRGLKFDLALIGLMQAAALVYGMNVVLATRPIFLVAVPDRFVLVSANEITDADLALGSEERFRSRSWTGPRLVGVEFPTNLQERNDLVFAAAAGRDIQNQPRYFRDFGQRATTLIAHGKPLEQLRKRSAQADQTLSQWLASSGHDPASVLWMPLLARSTDLVALIDAKSGNLLGALPIEPW